MLLPLFSKPKKLHTYYPFTSTKQKAKALKSFFSYQDFANYSSTFNSQLTLEKEKFIQLNRGNMDPLMMGEGLCLLVWSILIGENITNNLPQIYLDKPFTRLPFTKVLDLEASTPSFKEFQNRVSMGHECITRIVWCQAQCQTLEINVGKKLNDSTSLEN